MKEKRYQSASKSLSQLPALDDVIVKSILRQESERISYGFEHCSSFSASASDLAPIYKFYSFYKNKRLPENLKQLIGLITVSYTHLTLPTKA